ncbi:MAG: glycolate oxidase subunit GlcF [Gammaproteobacteria bacterium]|nr:glycolate oxidase subunit GlcF [Gammaproteobacteria bacterium]
MQTSLADFIKDTPQGDVADSILRKCVHCGFCTATCPTYQLLGDELDGPRGRIYLVKQVLEGEPCTEKTQLHLDRCLTCRSCETTCPSGVEFGRLMDIGREIVEQRVGRSVTDKVVRRGIRSVIPHAERFSALLSLGQAVRPVLPGALRKKVPPKRKAGVWPQSRHARRMLVLDGCAQSGAAPNINASAARVLDTLGISLIVAKNAGCCGAASLHLSAREEALDYMRRNIDAWWPYIDQGVESIVMTASGCGVTVKEYGELLAHDTNYAEKARHLSNLTCDLSEIVANEYKNVEPVAARNQRVAFHAPCTLQHGLKIRGKVEGIIRQAGYILTLVPDAHMCCGSAGTYSILQPELSGQLVERKVRALTIDAPDVIATANIGCLLHIESGTEVPVKHWIELLDN